MDINSNNNDDQYFLNMPKIIQPKNINISLLPHQLTSVFNMELFEKNKSVKTDYCIIETNIGINADKTGYGKTLSMITLIFRDKMKWDVKTPYRLPEINSFANGRIIIKKYSEFNKINCTLVLASQSIISQWKSELDKFTLKVCLLSSRKSIDIIEIDNYDVVLVTPSMYNYLICKYFNMAWKRFIYDEPGHMKVPAMKPIYAGFIWLVTSTPNAIQHTHMNCRKSFMKDLISHCIFPQSFEYKFRHMIIKNDEKYIEYSFNMPKTNNLYYKCYNPVYKTLNGFVSKRLSEMISAGNIQDVIKELGGGETKNITELVKKKKIEELDQIEAYLQVSIKHNKENQIIKAKEKIQRIKKQIDELDKRYKNMLNGDCNICFDKIKDPVMEPGCQNLFCGKCLLTWLKDNSTCPLCRKNVSIRELVYINSDEKQQNIIKSLPKIKTKINTLLDIIKSKVDGRFIIFSSWDCTFFPIRTELTKNNIKFIEIKGGISQRERNIKRFKNGDINVIFLNSRFNGSGINLQECSDIIIYHEMGRNMINQVLGRANRIGRQTALNVHYLEI